MLLSSKAQIWGLERLVNCGERTAYTGVVCKGRCGDGVAPAKGVLGE